MKLIITTTRLRAIFIGAVILIACIMAGCTMTPSPKAQKEVIVYTSVDQVYSEPVFAKYESRTGIRVRPVYDVEAAKTTGLVNRLIAEKTNPRADVFWSGEFAQTLDLKKEGVLAPYVPADQDKTPGRYHDRDWYWTGLGGRARVILINTRYINENQVPDSIFQLPDSSIPGDRIGIANPMFGTTATHASALYAYLGPGEARAYYEGLKKKGVRVVDGNAVVRDLVEKGDLYMGMTDTDDSCEAIARGSPVRVIFPDQGIDGIGTFIIPNTVALVAGGPNPSEGKAFIDYLLSQEVENDLMKSRWVQLPVRPVGEEQGCLNVSGVRGMNISMTGVAAQNNQSRSELADIFLR
jgi:iron(III) transport system substrate-binding protein